MYKMIPRSCCGQRVTEFKNVFSVISLISMFNTPGTFLWPIHMLIDELLEAVQKSLVGVISLPVI